MKVLRQIAHGDAAVALRLDEDPDPAPAPDEIVVALEVTPLHVSDLLNLTDPKRIVPTALPRIGGAEGVGRVIALGENVRTFKVGDRVFLPKYCGLWREKVPCLAAAAFHAPGDCPAENLSIIHTMGLTAYLLLEDYVKLPPGSWIIHDAANSSIGRIIIGLAHAKGLRTVNVVRRSGLDNELKALGGDAVVVDTGDADTFADAVATATGSAPIAVALDMIGGRLAGRLAHCLTDGGLMVLYGGSGPDAAAIDFIDLAMRGLTITGMGMSRSFNARSADEKSAIMSALGHLASTGAIKTNIAARYDLADYKAAFAHLARKVAHRDGKIVFQFSG